MSYFILYKPRKRLKVVSLCFLLGGTAEIHGWIKLYFPSSSKNQSPLFSITAPCCLAQLLRVEQRHMEVLLLAI